MTLIAIIVANILPSLKGFSDDFFFRKYEFHLSSVRAGQQYRMITSGFLHVDMAHLAFNMITLYFFAPVVLNYFNDISFLFIYFFSLLAGGLFALYFHQNEPSYRAVGASGAVTGILYSAILLNPSMNLYMFFIPIPIPAYIFGIGYLIYSIYGMKNRMDNIGHSAHFGGAIGGFASTLFLKPYLITSHPLMIVLLLIPIIILFILHKQNKI
jgi:membrane associated rhomboid family serine protease